MSLKQNILTLDGLEKSHAKREAFTPTTATLKYDEKRSVNPDTSENIIIEGENLQVLKLLKQGYRGKIKCIYIDPPYNTGNDFVYSDKWKTGKKEYFEEVGYTENGVKLDSNPQSSGRHHSDWLSMMYSRLLASRDLLRDDGVIFISIDDNEVHHLRKLCDEVFGEENFVNKISWQGLDTIKNDGKYFSDNHEYITCYAKNKDFIEIKGQKRTKEHNKVYKNLDNDPRGDYLLTPLHAKSGSENGIYTYTFKNNKIWKPPLGTYPRFSRETLKKLEKDNRIYFGKNVDNIPQKKTFLSQVSPYVKLTTFWDYKFAGSTRQSNSELSTLLSKGVFQNSKPVKLLKIIINSILNKNDIILDFFAGSGTTAHAVMQLNAEDGGNRKFIMVQIPETIGEKEEAYKAGFKTISDITIERNKRVIEKITKEKQEKNEDLPQGLGFKVFKLIKSNFPRVEFAPNPDATDEENIAALKRYIAEKETSTMFNKTYKDSIATEIAIKNGMSLNHTITPHTDISENDVLIISDETRKLHVCLDDEIKDSTIVHFKKNNTEKFICLERALDSTKKWNLHHYLKDNFKSY